MESLLHGCEKQILEIKEKLDAFEKELVILKKVLTEALQIELERWHQGSTINDQTFASVPPPADLSQDLVSIDDHNQGSTIHGVYQTFSFVTSPGSAPPDNLLSMDRRLQSVENQLVLEQEGSKRKDKMIEGLQLELERIKRKLK